MLLSLVVDNKIMIVLHLQDRGGGQGDLPPFSGEVQDVMGDAESGGLLPQVVYYLDSPLDGGPEVRCSPHRVSVKEVIRPYPHGQETLHQLCHDFLLVVDPSKEDGLTGQRDARVRQTPTGCPCLGSQLSGVVEMRDEKERLEPL